MSIPPAIAHPRAPNSVFSAPSCRFFRATQWHGRGFGRPCCHHRSPQLGQTRKWCRLFSNLGTREVATDLRLGSSAQRSGMAAALGGHAATVARRSLDKLESGAGCFQAGEQERLRRIFDLVLPRNAVAWPRLWAAMSALRRMDRSTTTQDSLLAAGLASPDGTLTRRVPMKRLKDALYIPSPSLSRRGARTSCSLIERLRRRTRGRGIARLSRVAIPALPSRRVGMARRGNRPQRTFFRKDDYRAYLDLMAESCGRCRMAASATV
jgi:hypothetical protein